MLTGFVNREGVAEDPCKKVRMIYRRGLPGCEMKWVIRCTDGFRLEGTVLPLSEEK